MAAARGKPASTPAVRPGRIVAKGEGAALSADAIVDAALELTEREGAGALTVRRLGSELGVDATAFYRHFRDKDELVLAVSDRIIAMTLDVVVESDDWRETLRSITSAAYVINLRYPAVTSITFARITGGRAERAIVEKILATISRAGLSPAETALYYRAIVDAMLSLSGQAAAVANLEPAVRAKDESAWTQIYGLLSQSDYPITGAHAKELAALSEQDVFETIIEAVIEAIAARAAATSPQPAARKSRAKQSSRREEELN
ncbi:TetR/AcrR family transcriptional regulator [uncultured Jatrophihabitans sp.]|uniref:TetR/AcrR family transcriptional regulator n=1 Tax=uncultured Jatrophihabitans sp. TaxID=1610747 RepID=UPI0035CC8696